MLGWSCICLSTVVSVHMKENQEISCILKGSTMYGEWLALHQVLRSWQIMLHIYLYTCY